MLDKIPVVYSPDAADAADRLRLLAADLRLAALGVQQVTSDGEDLDAIVMHLRRAISDADMLRDDILERDKKGGAL